MIDVVRPETSPPSLAKNRYDGPDVIEALHAAFFGKCYLCETCVEMGTFEIDHRKPKAADQFPEFACDWKNLFPTCNTHRCNQRREQKYPEGGLLDPAGDDRVEARVLQRIEGIGSRVLRQDLEQVRFVFKAVASEDIGAANTARELDRIHNGTGSTDKAVFTARALQRAVLYQVCLVAALTQQLAHIPEADGRRQRIRNELKALLSRRAPYTMLVRSYFARCAELCELFD